MNTGPEVSNSMDVPVLLLPRHSLHVPSRDVGLPKSYRGVKPVTADKSSLLIFYKSTAGTCHVPLHIGLGSLFWHNSVLLEDAHSVGPASIFVATNMYLSGTADKTFLGFLSWPFCDPTLSAKHWSASTADAAGNSF